MIPTAKSAQAKKRAADDTKETRKKRAEERKADDEVDVSNSADSALHDPLESLPPEIWTMVARRLPPCDRFHLAHTCHSLHSLVWCGVPPPELTVSQANAGALRSLPAELPSSTSIRLCAGSHTSPCDAFHCLPESLGTLRCLDFFPDAPMMTALATCTALRSLHFDGLTCPGSRLAALKLLPVQLTELTVAHPNTPITRAIAGGAARLTALKELSLGAVSRGVEGFAALTALESLTCESHVLLNEAQLTSLARLLQGLSSLRSLHLVHMYLDLHTSEDVSSLPLSLTRLVFPVESTFSPQALFGLTRLTNLRCLALPLDAGSDEIDEDVVEELRKKLPPACELVPLLPLEDEEDDEFVFDEEADFDVDDFSGSSGELLDELLAGSDDDMVQPLSAWQQLFTGAMALDDSSQDSDYQAADETTWACAACTLLNPSFRSRCAVCETPRPQEGS